MSALSTASIRDCYGADRLSQRGKQVDCTTVLCQPLSSPEAKRGSFYQPLHFLPTPTTHQPTAPRGALFRSPLSPPPLLPLPTFSEKNEALDLASLHFCRRRPHSPSHHARRDPLLTTLRCSAAILLTPPTFSVWPSQRLTMAFR